VLLGLGGLPLAPKKKGPSFLSTFSAIANATQHSQRSARVTAAANRRDVIGGEHVGCQNAMRVATETRTPFAVDAAPFSNCSCSSSPFSRITGYLGWSSWSGPFAVTLTGQAPTAVAGQPAAVEARARGHVSPIRPHAPTSRGAPSPTTMASSLVLGGTSWGGRGGGGWSV
jgi:hypothetical protein